MKTSALHCRQRTPSQKSKKRSRKGMSKTSRRAILRMESLRKAYAAYINPLPLMH